MEEKAVLKLYSRYEAYIGNVMTKSLKSAICGAYTTIMGVLVPSVSKGRYALVEGEKLSESLIENPVINLALTLVNHIIIMGIISHLICWTSDEWTYKTGGLPRGGSAPIPPAGQSNDPPVHLGNVGQ